MDMSFEELFHLIKVVVLSKEVLGAAVVIIFILNLVFYIVSYKKRPAGKRRRRSFGARSSPVKISANSSSGQADAYDSSGSDNISYDL